MNTITASKTTLAINTYQNINNNIRQIASTSSTGWYLYIAVANTKPTLLPIQREMVLGRTGDILFNQTGVSRQHAKLYLNQEILYLQDLGSKNGTYLDGKRLSPNTAHAVSAGRRIRLDTVELRVIQSITEPSTTALNTPTRAIADRQKQAKPAQKLSFQRPWWRRNQDRTQRYADTPMSLPSSVATKRITKPSLLVIGGPRTGALYSLRPGNNTLGRTRDNTFVFADTHISEKHIGIMSEDGMFRLVDLMSCNGIKVNGRKTLSHMLSDGDVIQLGPVLMRFLLPK